MAAFARFYIAPRSGKYNHFVCGGERMEFGAGERQTIGIPVSFQNQP